MSQRQRRRTAWGVGALVAVVALGVGVWWSGLLLPRFSHAADEGGRGYTWEGQPSVAVAELQVTNEGLLAEEVDAIGQSAPGMHLLKVEYPRPILRPGESMKVRLFYAMTDCSAVPKKGVEIPVRGRRWWGDVTVDAAFAHGDEGAWHASLISIGCDEP